MYHVKNGLRPGFTFDTFVEGASSQLARTASLQVSSNPGTGDNPLFICGEVGLGKTHLLQAIGNWLLASKPEARIVYRHSECFVADMIKCMQSNTLDEFQAFYRNLDALLLDDIQFFAGKERSQDELLHTFNALLEDQHQIVMSCDRYPGELSGVEERLKSRLGWGLTVAIEPAELETRIAILMNKAKQAGMELPDEIAFFVAKHFDSNIRELEGALHRILANSHFTGHPITLAFARKSIRDLLVQQDQLVSIGKREEGLGGKHLIRIIDILLD